MPKKLNFSEMFKSKKVSFVLDKSIISSNKINPTFNYGNDFLFKYLKICLEAKLLFNQCYPRKLESLLKIKLVRFFYFLIYFPKFYSFKKRYQNTDTLHNYRAISLIKAFQQSNPSLIYEFGSGSSTYLFCFLLKLQYDKSGVFGKLISFDQSQVYQNALINDFPSELRPFVDFKTTALSLFTLKNINFVKYDVKYHSNIDLCYFDGPSVALLPVKNAKALNLGNGNLLEMIKKSNFKIGIIDKRFNYVISLMDTDTKKYRISFSPAFKCHTLLGK